ncbi:hypothetical protein SAMN04487989_101980 [Bizionia echini]|uniref:Uncharacterized protein n=1 Tax=Bizionia echini TaxID=649333 RepID=A0A1I4ZPF2_9FLAO|nr:hypothetical protein [Bizionia echini]SFN52145.1 hypothetical protein SAMN04487989_101980 [Bizionia echini]|tara:strand:- start:42 stop:392 length:351 start_codon:yes stop_codon:yes gene_type:complete
MQLPTTFSHLIAEANQLNLYQKLISQLNKDLALANIDLEFDLEVLPSSLKFMLHEMVYKLIQEKFMDYLNLLYIIDVSEAKVRELDGSDTVTMAEHVAFLVLQREWQKVWFKSMYS